MKPLFLIPARGGSKGIPGKNIKPLAGKPLIWYAIENARNFANDIDICISTDSKEIKDVAEAYGIHVPFIRPAELANDNSGSYEVIMHALNFYKGKNIIYDTVVLLQPTSPFRTNADIEACINLYTSECEMVVSVKNSPANPYYNLFEEDKNGYLVQCKEGIYDNRQACPQVYEQNGAVYVMNVAELNKKNLSGFTKIKKYIMSEENSLDLDTPLDWAFAEFLIQNKYIRHE